MLRTENRARTPTYSGTGKAILIALVEVAGYLALAASVGFVAAIVLETV
jgi:hypothetical protein